ncbi:MAG TPA: crosslink repair DNA glycosylase YcaQ family protein [Acetobacteraceae bacterium]|nr:crosslink repair DNA glycosylase YcaQ family protein [Acetobacteraceae bacterium]
MTPDLGKAKTRLVQASLGTPTTLGRAIARLGFVQADPIRAPARAQDLTLGHRVGAYRAGDLDRRFVRLGIEEDFLYAYGFMPRATLSLLHPRCDPSCAGGFHVPSGLAADVLGSLFGRFAFLGKLFADSAYAGPIFQGLVANTMPSMAIEIAPAQ